MATRSPVVEPVETQGRFHLVPRDQLAAFAEAAGPACGTWAYEALRIARGEPRLGHDTDHRTIPNEVGWVGPGPHSAVHLDKGCYRGQETVARVHTLGRPPRRLTLLHLDGSENRLPAQGTPLVHDGRQVGVVGSSARHHELGPIALGLVKRNVPLEATLDADGMPVAPGGRGRPRGRPARPPRPALSTGLRGPTREFRNPIVPNSVRSLSQLSQ